MGKSKRDVKGLTVGKSENFSEWYSELVQKAELADIRYNVKGFLVFQPWSVMCMEKMYGYMERILKRKGHRPYYFPTLIPESNLKKESGHVKGFTPEVFWVTKGGNKELKEKLALRPTSETAFYQMFGIWIRSYKDMPFKTYQRANVFRYETKATRPFLRSREFHWIEAHCAFASEKEAENQVSEDMETTEEALHDVFCLPFIFFERPEWDKFPGARKTFAADVLNPDGRVVQQPSTHFISEEFAKAFNVKYMDKDEKEKVAHITCYGPAISRIFASVVIVHGDDKGLRFPWEIAPIQVMIVPLGEEPDLIKKADELKMKLKEIVDVEIDISGDSPGEKFNKWELKGVPIRIDIGKKELKSKKLTVYRRDLDKKEEIKEKELGEYVNKVANDFSDNLRKQADKLFKGKIRDAKDIKEIENIILNGGIARCGFCSIEKTGEKCAEKIEKEIGAKVRGIKLIREKVSGKCSVCDKQAGNVVYVARDY